MTFILISIHALVKRATYGCTDVANTGLISIHALVKRATFCFFNRDKLAIIISIHALVKRATDGNLVPVSAIEFQSTPS